MTVNGSLYTLVAYFIVYYFVSILTLIFSGVVMVKKIVSLDDESGVLDELRAQILKAAEEAISSRNIFKIGLSGSMLFYLTGIE